MKKNKEYSLEFYILLFFSLSFIGWLFEVGLQYVKTGLFLNRGSFYGPWIPIYGCGGMAILLGLKRFMGNTKVLFLWAIVLCGILEYGASCYLEYFKGLKYWDYSMYLLNVRGRICLEGLVLFGILGCVWVYYLAPFLANIYGKINKVMLRVLCGVLVFFFLLDFGYSNYFPNVSDAVNVSDGN